MERDMQFAGTFNTLCLMPLRVTLCIACAPNLWQDERMKAELSCRLLPPLVPNESLLQSLQKFAEVCE